MNAQLSASGQFCGSVGQLVERCSDSEKVAGSNISFEGLNLFRLPANCFNYKHNCDDQLFALNILTISLELL